MIKNLSNGKFYIGSAVDFTRRKSQHIWELENNRHGNKHLQKSYSKYGNTSFTFEIIEEISDNKKILEREQYYLDTLTPWDLTIGYNICKNAGNWLGNKHSEETKEKLRNLFKGRKVSDETRKKMSDSHPRLSGENHPSFGKMLSQEARKKIRDNHPRISGEEHPMFGKKWDDGHLSIFSEKSSGEKNPMYGISVFEVLKNKIGEEQAREKIKEGYLKISKSVIQKNLDGSFVACYDSITEASRKTGINNSTIGIACKNSGKKAGGYKWEYKNI